MQSDIHQAIVKTLLYSDIFDYPLTKEELWKYLILDKKISPENFTQSLHSLSIISQADGYYFIKDRRKIVALRKKRQKESAVKKNSIVSIVRFLSWLPTIQLIGLSGAVAVNNAEKNDDIDLFIITKKNTLWMTRFLVTALLSIIGIRRKRNDKKSKNKICLNMFMDESKLTFEKNRKDLFTAHEIVQVVLLFERNNIYVRFISANSWVKKFMFNSINIKRKKKKSPNILISQYLNYFEFFCKKIQLFYMKNHRTKELISDTILAFHPIDYRGIVLRKYKERLKKYEKYFDKKDSNSKHKVFLSHINPLPKEKEYERIKLFI
jgi:hypothetical protein